MIHVIARSFTDMTPSLLQIASGHDLGDVVLARGDEGKSGPHPGRDEPLLRRQEVIERQARAAMPVGRNFH